MDIPSETTPKAEREFRLKVADLADRSVRVSAGMGGLRTMELV